MKKSATFAALLGLVVLLVHAGAAQVPVRLGLKGGLNLGNAALDPESHYLGTSGSKSTRSGFVAGGVIDVGVSDAFVIQAEPRFIQKGLKVEEGNEQVKVNIDFVEIPVMAKARFGTGKVRPYIFAGPNIGFKVSSEAEVSIGGFSVTVDIDSLVESTDFAVDFGGGLEIEVAPNIAVVGDARYSLGLTDLDKTSGSPDPSIKSTGIQIIVGILFKLGN